MLIGWLTAAGWWGLADRLISSVAACFVSCAEDGDPGFYILSTWRLGSVWNNNILEWETLLHPPYFSVQLITAKRQKTLSTLYWSPLCQQQRGTCCPDWPVYISKCFSSTLHKCMLMCEARFLFSHETAPACLCVHEEEAEKLGGGTLERLFGEESAQ